MLDDSNHTLMVENDNGHGPVAHSNYLWHVIGEVRAMTISWQNNQPKKLTPVVTHLIHQPSIFYEYPAHFPCIQTILTVIFFSPIKYVSMNTIMTAMEQVCLVFLLIVRYHHVCHITLLTQDAFSVAHYHCSLQISWILMLLVNDLSLPQMQRWYDKHLTSFLPKCWLWYMLSP